MRIVIAFVIFAALAACAKLPTAKLLPCPPDIRRDGDESFNWSCKDICDDVYGHNLPYTTCEGIVAYSPPAIICYCRRHDNHKHCPGRACGRPLKVDYLVLNQTLVASKLLEGSTETSARQGRVATKTACRKDWPTECCEWVNGIYPNDFH